jgi:membrane protease YdiL (CAAX protease family)
VAKPAKKRTAGAPRAAPSKSGNPALRGRPVPVTPRPASPRPASPRPASPRPGGRAAGSSYGPPAAEPIEFLPVDGAEYPQTLRNPGYAWWRSLGGVGLGLFLFVTLSSVVSQIVVAVAWFLGGRSSTYAGYVDAAFAFEHPSGMLGANLGIVTLVPIAFGLMAVIHRVKPRWLASVAVVALNGVLVLSTLVTSPPVFGVQRGFWGFLVVILLTSPLQAAAEEIFFRGYLMQALGSLVAAPWFGVVVSSVVFALFHGTQNLPLFVDRLAFGLLAALLVWRTGGLEAGIAAHVVNNIFAYVVAGLTTSIATIRAVREITWADAAFDVGGFALFAVLAYLVSRRLQLRTQVDRTSVGEPGRTDGLV